MSVAGLRYQPDQQWTGPLETERGSYINRGDPQGCHDWEFKTRWRPRPSKPSDAGAKEATSRVISEVLRQEDPSPTSSAKETEKTNKKDRSVLVNRVLEGLRGEALEIARDLGLDALTADGILDALIRAMRPDVFPRAQGSQRTFSRAGQKIRGDHLPDSSRRACCRISDVAAAGGS